MISNNPFAETRPPHSMAAWTIVAWFLAVVTLVMAVMPGPIQSGETVSGTAGLLFAQLVLTAAFSLAYPKARLAAAGLAASFLVLSEIVVYFDTNIARLFALEWKSAGLLIGFVAAQWWNDKQREGYRKRS
jgi:hypothetical protein